MAEKHDRKAIGARGQLAEQGAAGVFVGLIVKWLAASSPFVAENAVQVAIVGMALVTLAGNVIRNVSGGRIAALLGLSVVLLLSGCAGYSFKTFGKQADDVGIVGVIETPGAELYEQLDTLPPGTEICVPAGKDVYWRRHKDFRRPIRAGERIFSGTVSECVKGATQKQELSPACLELLGDILAVTVPVAE